MVHDDSANLVDLGHDADGLVGHKAAYKNLTIFELNEIKKRPVASVRREGISNLRLVTSGAKAR